MPDVHAFPGHIACDSASASEIVVPVLKAGASWACSTSTARGLARFDEEDARGLEAVVAAFVDATDL